MVICAVQIKKLNGFELDIFGNAFLFYFLPLFIERNRVVRGQVMDRKKMKGAGPKEKIASQTQTCITLTRTTFVVVCAITARLAPTGKLTVN